MTIEYNQGPVAKLVDALDLGSSAAMCESSSLSGPTILKKSSERNSFLVWWLDGSIHTMQW